MCHIFYQFVSLEVFKPHTRVVQDFKLSYVDRNYN